MEKTTTFPLRYSVYVLSIAGLQPKSKQDKRSLSCCEMRIKIRSALGMIPNLWRQGVDCCSISRPLPLRNLDSIFGGQGEVSWPARLFETGLQSTSHRSPNSVWFHCGREFGDRLIALQQRQPLMRMRLRATRWDLRRNRQQRLAVEQAAGPCATARSRGVSRQRRLGALHPV